MRLRVLRRTDGERLCPHVHGYTFEEATVYTDGWKGYSQVERDRLAVVTETRNGHEMRMGTAFARYM